MPGIADALGAIGQAIAAIIAAVLPLALAYLAGKRGQRAADLEVAADSREAMGEAAIKAPRGREELVDNLRKEGL
jgi:hypothetical protein